MRDATRPPLAAPLRERALALLADGAISHRQIAVVLGVHRSTIDRLHQASGLPRDPLGRYQLPPGEEWVLESAPRCPGCGGKLTISPCILCRDRAAIADRRQKARGGW